MCVTYLRITDTFFVSYLLGGFWCQKNNIGLISGFLTWKDVDLCIAITSCMCIDTVYKAMLIFISTDSIYTHFVCNMNGFFTSIIISHISCWLTSWSTSFGGGSSTRHQSSMMVWGCSGMVLSRGDLFLGAMGWRDQNASIGWSVFSICLLIQRESLQQDVCCLSNFKSEGRLGFLNSHILVYALPLLITMLPGNKNHI